MIYKKKKKAQIGNVIVMFIIIFAVSLTVILGKYILDQFYAALDAEGISTEQMNETRAAMESNYMTFDYAIVMLTVIMIIGLMVTSFLIPTHPIFLVINIVGIFILIFLGMVLTNAYGEIVSGEGAEYLGDTADQFSLINNLMIYLPYIGAVAIFVSSIIMYSRSVG